MAATSHPARQQSGRGEPKLDAREQPMLLYLYCVLDPAIEAERLLRSRVVRGIDPGEPLFLLRAGGLVAAVSRVPAATFNEEALNALVGDLSRLAPLVLRHEEAVRTLFSAAAALVPMAFGAVYREPAGVIRFLEEEATRLSALLDKVRGKQEWGLKVFADRASLGATAERSSARLSALDDEIATVGPGRGYLLRRKRESTVADEVSAFLSGTLSATLKELEACSAEVRLDQVAEAQEGPTELVLKAAFLVDAARGGELQSAATALAAAHAPSGLSLELTGPWAPYSFAGATPHAG